MATHNDFDLIKELEERLFDPAVRKTPEMVGKLLADEFVEFGRSGGAYTKDEVIASLADEDADDKSKVVGLDYKLTAISDEAVLLTYRSVREDQAEVYHSRRSSIWKWIDGRWQMLFHQGTSTRPDR